MLTKLQVFEIVAEHFRTQADKAMELVNGKKMCVYRTKDGKKCAAGILIRDEDYSPDIEDVCCDMNPVRSLLCHVEDTCFLSSLQHIHDWTDVNEWHDELKKLANDNNLSIEVLQPGGKPETLRAWLNNELR